MNYERFSQLWDALVKHRPPSVDAPPITNGMTADTAAALIEYAKGNKGKIESVRAFLGRTPIA
jgi:hypothetical protein